ncbi:DUF4376 domain-containing protein [Moraxella sp. Pampa]|uniref:DUF4376 domain-containing protein n=1 Tax=Moraxella sp. Pampa TaxID=3111978 RepID=UPI002B40E0FA|nr:DUF4376 domain-containing protein [Moraxella sp. Pampa]
MKHFSPSNQAFYDLSLNYPNLPDDLVEIDEQTYQALFSKLGQGCHINADLSASEPQPSHHHIWQDGRWILDAEKSTLQDEVWEQIKQKRHTITRGGVYVKSVKKWFHTDDASRTQYLALQILPELPPELMWKTMDNSFVKMDKALITELAMTILQAEQANFIIAEKHKALMMQADNPLDYDYSTGWTAIYDEPTNPTQLT